MAKAKKSNSTVKKTPPANFQFSSIEKELADWRAKAQVSQDTVTFCAGLYAEREQWLQNLRKIKDDYANHKKWIDGRYQAAKGLLGTIKVSLKVAFSQLIDASKKNFDDRKNQTNRAADQCWVAYQKTKPSLEAAIEKLEFDREFIEIQIHSYAFDNIIARIDRAETAMKAIQSRITSGSFSDPSNWLELWMVEDDLTKIQSRNRYFHGERDFDLPSSGSLESALAALEKSRTAARQGVFNKKMELQKLIGQLNSFPGWGASSSP